MKKLFLLLFSVLAFTSQVRADVEWSIWKGENTDNVYIPKDLVANMEVGDKILVSFGQTDKEQDGELCIGWNTIAYKYMGEGYTNYFDYTNNKVTITITQTLKNQVAGTTAYTKYYWENEWKTGEVTEAGDLRIKANGSLNFTSIVLQKQKSFIAKSYNVTATIGNWDNTTKVNPEGLTSDDYLYFDATTTSNPEGYWQAELVGLGTIGVVGGFWFPVTTHYNSLNTSGADLKGRYINVTGMKQYHPVNSFKIGSIGMATFSAAQEVTVPEGLTAYKATISGDNVSLTQFPGNVIPANTGAIIVGNEGSVVEFEATSTSSTTGENALQAVTTATNVDNLAVSGKDLYVLYNNNPTGGITPLSLDNLNWEGWNSEYEASTKTIKFTGAWGARGWEVNDDYSNYSKIVVEFGSAAPSNGVLKVKYGDDTEPQQGYNTGAPSVEIDLDKDKKNSVKQIYLSAETANTTLTLKNAYLVKNSGRAVAEFRKATSGTTIAANKAYLMIPSGTGSSKLNIVFAEDENKQDEEQQGETNSIRNIANTNVNNNVVYNMNGQRVGSDYKGLVIVNGKKIIKK